MNFFEYKSVESFEKAALSSNQCWLYQHSLLQTEIPQLVKNREAIEFYNALERHYVLSSVPDWDSTEDANGQDISSGAIGVFVDFLNGEVVKAYPAIYFE